MKWSQNIILRTGDLLIIKKNKSSRAINAQCYKQNVTKSPKET